MKIGVIGLGLIGGSFALSSKSSIKGCTILGWDNNPEHLQQARQLKIIDKVLEDTSYTDLNLVILATPVDVALEIVGPLLDKIGPETLLMDTGSTKRWICHKVSKHTKRDQFFGIPPHSRNGVFGAKSCP